MHLSDLTFGPMELAKGLPAAVDEPGILSFKSCFSRNDGEYAISKKN